MNKSQWILITAVLLGPQTGLTTKPSLSQNSEKTETEMVAQDSVYLTWVQSTMSAGATQREQTARTLATRERTIVQNKERLALLDKWLSAPPGTDRFARARSQKWKSEKLKLLLENSALYSKNAKEQFALYASITSLNRQMLSRFLQENERRNKQLMQLDRLLFAMNLQGVSRSPSWHQAPFIENFRLVRGLFQKSLIPRKPQ